MPLLARPAVFFVPARQQPGRSGAQAPRPAGAAEFWRAEALQAKTPAAALPLYSTAIAKASATSAIHAAALWQRAITHDRLDHDRQAARDLRRLLRLRSRAARWLRPHAIALSGVVFGDATWAGKSAIPGISPPAPKTGVVRRGGKTIYVIDNGPYMLEAKDAIENLERFFRRQWREPHVQPVYQAVAQLFYDTTRYDGVEPLVRRMSRHWPHHANAPQLALLCIDAYERQRLFKRARRARADFPRRFGPGSNWWRANARDGAALARARKLLGWIARPKSRPTPHLVPSLEPQKLLQMIGRRQPPPWQRCAQLAPGPGMQRIVVEVSPQSRIRAMHARPRLSHGSTRYWRCVERQLVGLPLSTDGISAHITAHFLTL